jgi:dTDP-4-amino-4,6-dideoxygalactose transaminase
MYKIPFNRADITVADQAMMFNAIQRGHISGNGFYTKQAESLIEQSMDSAKALLTTSCTHALEMSALLANLKPGDEVIVPAFTFVSTASAFMLYGAKPVFVDVQSDTLNIDPGLVEAFITPRTRAICVVHYAGVAANLERLQQIAKTHNLVLIEDNAHGLFATYKNKPLGTFGALATQSFHETKNVTCGEGGALIINDAPLVERAEILREKGTDRTKFLRGQVDKYTWVDVGSSWVMSDMLAAVLYSQLGRSNEITQQRLAIYNRYDSELKDWASKHNVVTPTVPTDCKHTAHMFHLRFEQAHQRDAFIDHLAQHQILAVFHYQSLHLSKVGLQLGGRSGQCPITEHASECLVRLPLYNTLTESEQTQVIDAVTSFSPAL